MTRYQDAHRIIALTVLLIGAGSSNAVAVQAGVEPRTGKTTLLRTAPPPATDFTITTKIQPAEYLGPCPEKVAFIATITSKKAGPIRYRLRTSDNVYDPVRELMFTAPGTKSFAVTRELPPPGSGWAFFEIVGPAAVSSEQAYYNVQCTNDPRSPSAARPSERARSSPTQKLPPGAQVIAEAPLEPEALVLKPDLVITGVTGSHVKGDGAPGTLVWKFLVEIKNNGLAEAGGSILCAHENPALAAQASKNPVPTLGSQQSAKVEYWYGKPTWWFVDGGERKKRPLVFVADCLGSMAEGSETNNQYLIWLYWDPTEAKTWEPAQ